MHRDTRSVFGFNSSSTTSRSAPSTGLRRPGAANACRA